MDKMTLKDITRQRLLWGSFAFTVAVAAAAFVSAVYKVDLSSATPIITFALTSIGLGVIGNFATKPKS